MRLRLPLLLMGLTASAAACSIANRPDDPIAPTSSSNSAGGGMSEVCGDGVATGVEQCDDGMETANCNSDCTHASCGDGVVNRAAMEECDDGNSAMGDACSPDCKATPFDIDDMALTSLSVADRFNVMVTSKQNGDEVFTVVWSRQPLANSNDRDIVSAVYTGNGEAIGTTLAVSSSSDGGGASLAYNKQGRGLAVWRGTPPAPAKAELRYRFIGDNGVPEGSAQQLLALAEPRENPLVAAGDDDGFCIYWVDEADDIGRLRCLDAMGNPNGNLETIEATSKIGLAAVFGTASLFAVKAGYMLGYTAVGGSSRGQLVNLSGTKQGGPFGLWQGAGAVGYGNGVGSATSGAFTIVGNLDNEFGMGMGMNETRVIMRRFNSAGNPAQAEQLLGDQHVQEIAPWITRRPDGGPFLVTWSRIAMMNGCHLVMRRYQANGVAVGPAKVIVEPGADACTFMTKGAANLAGDVFLTYIEHKTDGSFSVRGLIYRRMLE